jgi:predicted DNA binding CopG/RHH family protein
MSRPDFGAAQAADLDALAEHFDRTDARELPWDEATEVTITHPDLEQTALRLPREDLAELKRCAASAGISYTPLIRMILRQHLRNPLTRWPSP